MCFGLIQSGLIWVGSPCFMSNWLGVTGDRDVLISQHHFRFVYVTDQLIVIREIDEEEEMIPHDTGYVVMNFDWDRTSTLQHL